MDQGQENNAVTPLQPCVLLAEDDRSARRYLEAMKLALSSHIDAVIADSIMPHLSGQELCRLLRSNPKVSRLPMVLLTALENKGTINAQDEHLDACLYKPVSAEELTGCLARLLGTTNR